MYNLIKKKNHIYKIEYIQNVIYTNKYTYFIFSCFVYPVIQIIRVIYLFSLKYFPTLFLKTINYLNYIKVDENLVQFLYADDFEVLDSLFHKYSLSKYFGSMFHILRFQGYHINPFSFLGSICYIKEIKIICHFF